MLATCAGVGREDGWRGLVKFVAGTAYCEAWQADLYQDHKDHSAHGHPADAVSGGSGVTGEPAVAASVHWSFQFDFHVTGFRKYLPSFLDI